MRWTRQPARSSQTLADAEFVRSIAEHSAELLFSQLTVELARMDSSELRGYVRARATAVVRDEIAATAASESQRCSAAVVLAAVEQTVHLVVRRHWIDAAVPRSQRRVA